MIRRRKEGVVMDHSRLQGRDEKRRIGGGQAQRRMAREALRASLRIAPGKTGGESVAE